MNVAVIVFPGSNSALEIEKAVAHCLDQSIDYVRHTVTDLSRYDVIVLPGGASYGDYLRPGAVASRTPIMNSVKEAADKGKLVLGIGNGFQVLTEVGLLPGTLLRNEKLRFNCEMLNVKVENNQTPFTLEYEQYQSIRLPVAHAYGNYYCDEDLLKQLEQNEQIMFRYETENLNGSVADIAGVINEVGNVLGLMPHTERAIHDWLGSTDGKGMFTSILKYWRDKHGAA